MISLFLLRKRYCQGFTLIELLVIIAIVAVLAFVGVAIFGGITTSTNDAKRKNDIKAIASAFENKFIDQYQNLADQDFTSGYMPTPPEGGNYNIFTNADQKGFRVCAALDGHPSGSPCDANSSTCFCIDSIQSPYIASGLTPTPTSVDSTSTPTPTTVSATSTPTLTPVPTPVPCILTSAFWGVTNIIEGNVVDLNVVGNNQCAGQQVTFEVRRNGTLIDDIPADIQPVPAIINGLFQATTTWIAERNPLFPFTDPQYYFKATPSGGATIDTKPQLLTVQPIPSATPTPSPTPLPTNTPTPIPPTPTPIPPTPTPGSSAIFLDGFESNDFSAWSGSVASVATMATGPTFALTGLYGAQFSVNTTIDSGFSAAVYENFTPPGSNKIYLKTQIKVNSYAASGYNVTGSKAIMKITDSAGNRMVWLPLRYAWSNALGKNQLAIQGAYRSKSGSDTFFGTAQLLNENSTYTVKLMIDKSGANPVMQYWVNAVTFSATDATVGVDGVGRTFGRGYFGINHILNSEKGNYSYSMDQAGIYDADPG